MNLDLSDRHPSTQNLARWFDADHLPEGPVRTTSLMCGALAEQMIRSLPDGPELSEGLRKLLEAKDCFVRQSILAKEQDEWNNAGRLVRHTDD